MQIPEIITAEEFPDSRGILFAFNDFDMREVVRRYEILPAAEGAIRAWQAHKQEKKWFYCIAGSFHVALVKIANFESPATNPDVTNFHLRAEHPQILAIPGGYANGYRALEPNSRLIVYSNFTLSQSAEDDYRYPEEYWQVDWNKNN